MKKRIKSKIKIYKKKNVILQQIKQLKQNL